MLLMTLLLVVFNVLLSEGYGSQGLKDLARLNKLSGRKSDLSYN